ncbi:hemolysin family protein [Canibacter zhoujuaniae]|uniref:hemolysin family protein n=1 Tax=Canibacter zhoujuaniae TaxID=2708343 RepID=UPI0014225550|nr:hemolysin family protein [Canibacter zhoujuaniae]
MSLGLALAFIGAAIVLLSVGALLAAADAALTARSRADIFKLAVGSSRVDRALRKIAEDEAAHQTAMSFARISAESLAAVLITLVIFEFTDSLWLSLATATLFLIISTFILVGASPRLYGINRADKVLRFATPLMRAVRILVGPVAIGMLRINTAVGERAQQTEQELDADRALLSLVDRAAERDVLEEEDRDYIHSLLRFGDTRVRELMVPRTDMMTVEAETSMAAALETLLASRRSRMPVINEDADDVLGVIHLRDASGFVLRHSDEALTAPVTRMMKPALFVPDLMRADALLQQMQLENNHLALTVDEYGGVSGLVTLEDLIEELVGDIYDEHDRELQEVAEQHDGSFMINPRLTVQELGELFEIELEDEHVDTVAGLMVKELDRLAEDGDTATVAGIELTVTQVDRRNRILQMSAVWVGEPEADEETEESNDE